MSLRTWEDGLNPASCSPERSAMDAALAEQRAMILQLRGGDPGDPPPPRRRHVYNQHPDVDEWDKQRIRALRTRLGVSQDVFARMIGTNQKSCSSWELGYTRPSYNAIDRLIEIESQGATT